jgi:hypothetical protein
MSPHPAGLSGDSCTPDAVSDIVVQITAVVSTCVVQLQAAAKVDLTVVDLTSLCATIYALLTVSNVLLSLERSDLTSSE